MFSYQKVEKYNKIAENGNEVRDNNSQPSSLTTSLTATFKARTPEFQMNELIDPNYKYVPLDHSSHRRNKKETRSRQHRMRQLRHKLINKEPSLPPASACNIEKNMLRRTHPQNLRCSNPTQRNRFNRRGPFVHKIPPTPSMEPAERIPSDEERLEDIDKRFSATLQEQLLASFDDPRSETSSSSESPVSAVPSAQTPTPSLPQSPSLTSSPSLSSSLLQEEKIDFTKLINETKLPDPGQLPDFSEMLQVGKFAKDHPDAAEWIHYLENILILGYQVSQATTMLDVLVAFIAYIKMHTEGSIVAEILDVIGAMSGHFGPELRQKDAWTAEVVMDTWSLLKTNTVYNKISYLMSAAMSLSVCKTKKVEWSIAGLDMISIYAAKEQLKAFDIIDALLVTFNWVADTGYRVFQERSLTPILYADGRMKEYNDQVDHILSHADAVLAGNEQDAEGFFGLVQQAIIRTAELKSAKANGPTSIWLQTKYEKLVAIKFKLDARFKNTALRYAPIGFHFSGPSSVGKSTLTKVTMNTSLAAQDLPIDQSRIIVDDRDDDYDSSIDGAILGMVFDDVAQGKSQFTKKSPVDRIIKFFNNVAAKAVRAELNQKGVCFVAFRVGIITSNYEDFGARHYSDKPEAVLRRFWHVRTRIIEKYRVPGGVSLNTDHPDLVNSKDGLLHNVWELTIEEVFIYTDKKGSESYRFQTVILPMSYTDGPRICKDLTCQQFLKVVVYLSRLHKRKQDKLLTNCSDFDKLSHCLKCCLPTPYCGCLPQKDSFDIISHQVQDVVTDALVGSVTRYFDNFLDPVRFGSYLLGYSPIAKMTTRQLTAEFSQQLHTHCTPHFVALTPEFLFQWGPFQTMVGFWQVSAALYDTKGSLKKISYLTMASLLYAWWIGSMRLAIYTLIFGWLFTVNLWFSYRKRLKMIKESYIKARDALPCSIKIAKESHLTHGAMALASLVVCTKMYMIWRRNNEAPPEVQCDSKIDTSTGVGWFGYMMDKIGMKVQTDEKVSTAVPSHLIKTFEKHNHFWADFTREDGTKTGCNIFFPRKSVAIFPKHVFHVEGDMNTPPTGCLTVSVQHENSPGSNFEFKSSLGVNCIYSKQHDLVFAFVENCFDARDKTHFLPLARPVGTAMATLFMRDRTDVMKEATNVTLQATYHDQMEFYGGVYPMTTTPNGKCMSMLLSETKNPCILGFHVGSIPANKIGIMQTLTKPEYDILLTELELLPHVCLSAKATDLPMKQYDIPLTTTGEIHKNSMAAHLDGTHYVHLHGATALRSKMKSRVVTSPLSPFVTQVTGVENVWGKPKLDPNWKAFNATLEHVTNPATMFDPRLLARARDDWLSPLLEEARKPDPHFRPLTFREAISGIDGVKYIDALDFSTSVGFPIFGPKTRWFDNMREPDPQIVIEYDRMQKAWSSGFRAYPVSVATLKDEATSIDSAKVRVFQAAPIAMSLHIRRLFLPVVRFLHLHPELSESAVGVNSFSPQWDQLMTHIETFNDKQMLAWDYSKYDVRMNSQVVRAVLLSFIDLARAAGYPLDELHTMEMMIVDIAHPLLDWNGVLMMAFNMNTSGNNITVDINGAAGSLYVRMGFFSIYPDAKYFRDHVAAMTYGDDFKGSVDSTHMGFNFRTFQAFLAKHKMGITLPNKSSDIVDFLDNTDADFLKRNSNYIPEIGLRIGAIDEMSIFKSWHANLKSKSQLPTEVACSCIESGLHEFFAHGREVYEKRRAQADAICLLAGISVPATKVMFDERVEFWLSKYQS